MAASDLVDPRPWNAANDEFAVRLHAAAQQAIDAASDREADRVDAHLRRLLESALARGDGDALAHALANAPSHAVARHLRRLLVDIERGDPRASESLGTTLFAIPVIVVAALDGGDEAVTVSGILRDVDTLAQMLREAGAFGGNKTFALSSALAAVDAIDIGALPALLERARVVVAQREATVAPLDLAPAPIDVNDRRERVHLRFIAGVVLATPRKDPLQEASIGRWGIRFAQALAAALRIPGISVLALPRPAARLVAAVQAGRAAQREVSAQLFASNAIRKFRASYGEPTAIISAHRAADAPGGGELRLSLSSPFAPKEAEGFRCPIYAYEPVQEAGEMLHALMRDCRISDVRFVAGVHEDVDPVTGGPLFFKNTGAQALH